MRPRAQPVVFYEDDASTIYLGDYRQVLPFLRAESVDLVLADPPYGDTKLGWDVASDAWLVLSERLLKRSGSVWCFGSMRALLKMGARFEALAWHVAQDIVWEKHNGSGFHADRFKRVHEHAVQVYRRGALWASIYKDPVPIASLKPRVNRHKSRPPHMGRVNLTEYVAADGGPRLMRSIIKAASCHGQGENRAKHPTQKPVELLSPLVRYSCPRSGVVLDPAMGVGSTLVAAKALGRRAVGIEISEAYCEQAAWRLARM